MIVLPRCTKSHSMHSKAARPAFAPDPVIGRVNEALIKKVGPVSLTWGGDLSEESLNIMYRGRKSAEKDIFQIQYSNKFKTKQHWI